LYTIADLAADIDSNRGFSLNYVSTTSKQIVVNSFNFREFWHASKISTRKFLER
jgi:hypothetical protein